MWRAGAAAWPNGNWRFHPRGQPDLAMFCNQWMVNIKQQQWDATQRTFFPTPTTENMDA
jgi:hypothetical protein